MGTTVTKASSVVGGIFGVFGNEPAKILMVGLDGAGKTSILYHLKLDQHIETVPTIGINVENITYKNLTMNVCDCGGQERIRALWRHHFEDVNAIIFVLDAADPDRFLEAKQSLDNVLNDYRMDKVSLLVYANKIDKPEASTVADITTALGLNSHTKKRKWYILPSSAISGLGLYEGLEWLSTNLTPSPP